MEVRWIPRVTNKEDSVYLSRVKQMAGADPNANGLAVRPHHGSDLGIRGLSPERKTMSTWRILGVREWTPDMLTQWLAECGWEDVSIVAPPSGKAYGWLIKGDPKNTQPDHGTVQAAEAWSVTFPDDARPPVQVQKYVMAAMRAKEEMRAVRHAPWKWGDDQQAAQDASKATMDVDPKAVHVGGEDFEKAFQLECARKAEARAAEDKDLDAMEPDEKAKAADERKAARDLQDHQALLALQEKRKQHSATKGGG